MRSVTQCNPLAMFGLAVFSLIGAAIAALGCAWPGTSHSVRFNSYQGEREMGRLPPLPTMANGLNSLRAAWDDVADEDTYADYSTSEDHSKKIDSLWTRAGEAEENTNLRLTRDLLVQYLKEGSGQSHRNSAIDRLDALGAIDEGASAAAVTAYLEARRCHDQDVHASCDVEKTLETAVRDRHLKDNVAYLRAAEVYQQEKFDEAAT